MSANSVNNYGWKSAKAPESSGYINSKVVVILKSLAQHRIVDIGSGNGNLCAEILKLGLSATGIEYDKGGCEIAKSAYPAISFYNFGVEDDPALLLQQELPFDAVVSTEVVEHLYAPHCLPQYAHAILKANGYLIVSTPYHGWLKNLALSAFDKWDKHHTALWHGGHIKFWSRRTLTMLLESNGFKVTQFFGVGRAPYLWKSMILVAQKI